VKKVLVQVQNKKKGVGIMIKVPISRQIYEKYYLFKPKHSGELTLSHGFKTDKEVLPKDIYINYRPSGMFEILGELDFEDAKHVRNIIVDGKLYDVTLVYDCSNLMFRIVPWVTHNDCTIVVNEESYEKALKEKEEYYNSKLLDDSKYDNITDDNQDNHNDIYEECVAPPPPRRR
jgi:hypothetical protein